MRTEDPSSRAEGPSVRGIFPYLLDVIRKLPDIVRKPSKTSWMLLGNVREPSEAFREFPDVSRELSETLLSARTKCPRPCQEPEGPDDELALSQIAFLVSTWDSAMSQKLKINSINLSTILRWLQNMLPCCQAWLLGQQPSTDTATHTAAPGYSLEVVTSAADQHTKAQGPSL